MDELISKIKDTGYWRIEVRPTTFEERLIPNLSKAQSIIEKSQVRLRGWPYPAIDNKGMNHKVDCVESGYNWNNHVEYWKLYQSGQFIHYLACREDYAVEEATKRAKATVLGAYSDDEVKNYLSIFLSLYLITEMFEFSIRLVQNYMQISDLSKLYINITLFGAKDRMLFFWDFSRELHGAYISRAENIPIDRTVLLSELFAEGHSLALDTTIKLFQHYNWENPPQQILMEQQRKLLEHNL